MVHLGPPLWLCRQLDRRQCWTQSLERHPTPKPAKRSSKQAANGTTLPLPKGRKGGCCAHISWRFVVRLAATAWQRSTAAGADDVTCQFLFQATVFSKVCIEQPLTFSSNLVVQTASRGRRCGSTCTRCSCRSTWATCAPPGRSCRPRVSGCSLGPSVVLFLRLHQCCGGPALSAADWLIFLTAMWHPQPIGQWCGRQSRTDMTQHSDVAYATCGGRSAAVVNVRLVGLLQLQRRIGSGRQSCRPPRLPGARSSAMWTASTGATAPPVGSRPPPAPPQSPHSCGRSPG